jgi:hypothetical protein
MLYLETDPGAEKLQNIIDNSPEFKDKALELYDLI